LRTALLAGALAFAASSCTTNDPNLQLAMPGNTAPAAAAIPAIMADVAADHAAAGQPSSAAAPVAGAAAAPSVSATNAGAALPAPAPSAFTQTAFDVAAPRDPLLPDVVAYVPTPKPDNPFAAAMPALAAATTSSNGATVEETAAVALPETAMVPQPAPATGQLPGPAEAATAPASVPPQAAAYAEPAAPAPAAPKRRGFFASLFSPPTDRNAAPTAEERPVVVAAYAPGAARPLIDPTAAAKPIVELTPAAPAATHHEAEGDQLPGVRTGNSLFEITRKSGGGDNSDIDINEEDGEPVEVASAAGMARIDPHGLILQRETVDTACLRPALLSVLKKIEEHYGRKLIVTSGYRSPIHNVAAHGALNSLHMFCAAADVQMPGVSKWELAAYARSMPGRGGVGTYCSTTSVHIDIGPERDWNWRCRRKRHRG
jgi:uncharacterized protein YcbK (DUF882 family)